MEILTAYVRKNSRYALNHYYEMLEAKGKSNQFPPNEVSLDIQAILTVIGRRKCPFEEEIDRLDLCRTYLRKVDLIDANLDQVNLEGAD